MSERGVCVCLSEVLIPGPWFFPCLSHNDNSACPGEAQLVSHVGSFASPPCVLLGEEAEHVEISLTLVSAVPRSEKQQAGRIWVGGAFY